MKKIIMSTAILLGGLTALTAQNDKVTAKNESKQSLSKTRVEKPMMEVQVADAKTDARLVQNVEQKNLSVAKTVQDYKEVKSAELPEAVQTAVAADFDGATISKAYVNAQGDYKIELATADGKKATAYANAKGEWIKNELKKQ